MRHQLWWHRLGALIVCVVALLATAAAIRWISVDAAIWAPVVVFVIAGVLIHN
jgi:hypothetical protein